MIDVLNLGCGMKRIEKEGWRVVNNDRMEDPKRPWIDVVWDLDTIPWPWEDNSFDRVVALSVFEHLRITLFEGRPDDLLIFNICGGEGYETLCPFLGLPILGEPFPHENRG
jgi:predicted SAM-dependent methyltransferase